MRIISILPGKNKRRIIFFAFIFLFILGSAWWYYSPREDSVLLTDLFRGVTKGDPPDIKEPNILNGLPVDPDLANRRPLAIMVENHTEARPQVGLIKAAIVFEAIAEGGITRFMAVFGPFEADKVGPVRSARQYYVEWAKGLDAIYAHVGGSQDVRSLIKSVGLSNLDQFRYGTKAYWREPKPAVAIEHTMFTSTAKLYATAKDAKFNLKANFKPYTFKDDAVQEERGISQLLTIDFSLPAYKVLWTYDPATNLYLRTQGGVAHIDRETGERIVAKAVAVAVVKRQLRSEEEGPGYTMTTTGSGRATVLQDGKAVLGTWKRPTKEDMLRFYDEGGREISLNRGQLWIEIVPPEVKYTVE